MVRATNYILCTNFIYLCDRKAKNSVTDLPSYSSMHLELSVERNNSKQTTTKNLVINIIAPAVERAGRDLFLCINKVLHQAVAKALRQKVGGAFVDRAIF